MRVAIAGAGDISVHHIQFLKELNGIELCGICDSDEKRSAKLAKAHQIARSYSQYDEMIEHARPDVVHILVPPRLHASFAISAMKRGCHVLIEKPMAIEEKDAIEMARISGETSKRLAVCEMYSYDPVIQKTRILLHEGIIGRVIHIEGYWFTDVRADTNAYSLKGDGHGWAYALRGSVFGNFLDHPVYLQRDYLGDIAKIDVTCQKLGDNPFVPFDEVRIQLVGRDATGFIVSSLNSKLRTNMLRFYGTEGMMTVDISNMALTTVKDRKLPSFLIKGINNLSQSSQLFRDTFHATKDILLHRIKAREGLRQLIKHYYSSFGQECTSSLNAESSLQTNRILARIWHEMESQYPEMMNTGKRSFWFEKQSIASDKNKILVTGASGFLGKHLVNELLREGHSVRIVTRKEEKALGNNPQVDIVYGDVRNPDCIDLAMKDIKTVYHCAAITSNKGTWDQFYDTNVRSTQLLLEAAKKNHTNRFIYISTVAVYGFNRRKGNRAITEKDDLGNYYSPYCYYAKSKAMAELLVKEYNAEQALQTVIIRPGIIYGPGSKGSRKMSRFVFGAKGKILPYVYVGDVVAALMRVLQTNNAIGQIYNIVGNQAIKQGQFAKMMRSASGSKSRSFFVPRWVMYITARLLEAQAKRKKKEIAPPFGMYHYRSMVRNLKYDNIKAKSELEWEPKLKVEDGIRRMLSSE